MNSDSRLHLVVRENTAENFLKLIHYGEYFERHYSSRGSNTLDYTTELNTAPRRSLELSNGSSIYWVLNGFIQIRSDILSIEGRVISISPRHVPTLWKPKRIHGEWEYLHSVDAPPDVGFFEAPVMDAPSEMLDMYRKLNLLDWLK